MKFGQESTMTKDTLKIQNYNSLEDTLKHIKEVKSIIDLFIFELERRKINHDISKLSKIEKSFFDEFTPKLWNLTYGSLEYKKTLEKLKPALDHHYKNNRHHPEHFKNGINDMNLIDVIEMFSDWLAATKRHANGDIIKSIEINKDRFKNLDN